MGGSSGQIDEALFRIYNFIHTLGNQGLVDAQESGEPYLISEQPGFNLFDGDSKQEVRMEGFMQPSLNEIWRTFDLIEVSQY
ncbi:MAG: hypothetical protein LAO21_03295 [Acidobacteriia bacterium]|nr:hypothetical protein [Terriglobia bacterium]